MEIKATLQKPYEEQQRIDFIIQQNHRLGYEIRETETELQAWGYTEEELLAQAKESKQQANIDACTNKRYNQTFTIELQNQICEFDTSEQTQRDLMAAGLVTSTGVTYDNWVCNNGVVINLTNTDVQLVFAQFFMMISPLYTIEKQYAEQIEACTTVEEVNAIELNYEINEV